MTPAKKWFIAAGALVAAYLVYANRKHLIQDLDIAITQFGNPTIQAGVISAPVQLTINNGNMLPIPVSNLVADIYLLQQSGWLKIGSTTPTGAFSIRTGQSNLVLQPNINTKAFGTNLFSALTNLLTSKPVLKVVSIATIAGKNIVNEKTITL